MKRSIINRLSKVEAVEGSPDDPRVIALRERLERAKARVGLIDQPLIQGKGHSLIEALLQGRARSRKNLFRTNVRKIKIQPI